MKILSTWKLLRTTRRFRIRSPFVRHTPLTYRTRNFPPPVHLSDRHPEPGKLSRMFSPFVGITYYRDWAHLVSILVMSCIVMHLFALYSLFLPPLLSGRPRDRCWCPCDRLRRWRPLLLTWATRQAPPLIILISPIPFSHACIRFWYCYWLLQFWCIACFCNLLLYLTCLR